MIPFKYKLTFIFSFLIICILFGSFLIVQKKIKQAYIVRIKNELIGTEFTVAERMKLRKERLKEHAMMLENNPLIKTMLRDASLDRATRDDIIKDEILQHYDSLKYIVLTDSNGGILATNALAKDSDRVLRETELIKRIVLGKHASDHVFWKDVIIQLIGHPIFENEVMTGALIVGFVIDDTFVKSIKHGFGVDMGLLKNNVFVKRSTWDSDAKTQEILVDEFQRHLNQLDPAHQKDKTNNFFAAGEQFIYYFNQRKDRMVPHYVLLKSLDRELAFVDKIKMNIFWIAGFGIVIGFLTSYVLSLNITRPIEDLQIATRELEKENYDHRLAIHTKDEFRQLGQSFNQMISGMGEKEKIRGVLNKSVSKEVAEELLKSDIQLGGEKKKATVLFSDIRDFTVLSENLDPKELLNLINHIFTEASNCIEHHKGVIDKFMGDSVMALFGLPLVLPNHAKAAVLAGLDVLDKINQINDENSLGVNKTINLGIGINTGTIVAGNMGAEHRMNYTVLGDEVNLASRIEGLTKHYRTSIIVTESTYNQAKDLEGVVFRKLDNVFVKGKENGVPIYDILRSDKIESAALIKGFDAMHDLLHKQDFDVAHRCVLDLCKSYPKDGPASIFAERIALFKDNPKNYQKVYQNQTYRFDIK